LSTFKLPPLYKRNVQGKIELWKVFVVDNYIEVVYGEHGSAKFQRKVTKITKGKSVGKKNETTPHEQAESEAMSKWEKKLKSGYVQNLKDAQAGKTDKIIKGGIVPMLAAKYSDKMKLDFPVYVQPKLDGERCIATRINGEVTLWTRTRKQITSCPHIIVQLKDVLASIPGNLFIDGELYIHMPNDKKAFEKLMSAIRKVEPTPESRMVEFHVYDGCHLVFGEAIELSFEKRFTILNKLPDYYSHIKFVNSSGCLNHKEIKLAHDYFTSEGYEGLMVREPESFYEHKRSKALLKMKQMHDAEFEIVNVVAGKDNTVVFVCLCKKETFGVTMSGNKKDNQKYLKNKSLWEGKKLTVQYQRLTGKNQVPLFPVGLRIREDI
jgi:DNA ligase-1